MTMQTPNQTPAAETKPAAKRVPIPLNGVDTPTLFATIGAVRQQPELAAFTFRATNTWQAGTHSRTRLETFSGAGGDHQHSCDVEFDADHPAVLCGQDRGPTPPEILLHGLAGCLMAGIGNIAAARGVALESVTATIEGNVDLRGLLGLADDVRNGFSKISLRFDIKGDASPEKLREIVEQSRKRSAVFDMLTNPVDVTIAVAAG